MHAPMAEQQRWYASILRGHYGYYGLSNNSRALSAFDQEVRRIWFRCLRQRSQKARSLTWEGEGLGFFGWEVADAAVLDALAARRTTPCRGTARPPRLG